MILPTISLASAALLLGIASASPIAIPVDTPITEIEPPAALFTRAISVATTYSVDPSLPGSTIYRPQNLKAFNKLPVLVWGNGACSANSLSHKNFLLEVASWGIIAIASGNPNKGGSTSSQTMTAGITWAVNNAGKGTWANLDASRIGAAGMSCGGIEAYAQAFDSRVKNIGIFNSGQYDAAGTQRTVTKLTKPIFFFLGGKSDIAYNNGMRDFAAVPNGIPSWVGNIDVGHGGTYGAAKGGKFGTAAQNYYRWALRGDQSAAAYFKGNGYQADGWAVQSKSLDRLNVNPI